MLWLKDCLNLKEEAIRGGQILLEAGSPADQASRSRSNELDPICLVKNNIT